MANATSLANRIESVLAEEFHDHAWFDEKVISFETTSLRDLLLRRDSLASTLF